MYKDPSKRVIELAVNEPHLIQGRITLKCNMRCYVCLSKRSMEELENSIKDGISMLSSANEVVVTFNRHVGSMLMSVCYLILDTTGDDLLDEPIAALPESLSSGSMEYSVIVRDVILPAIERVLGTAYIFI